MNKDLNRFRGCLLGLAIGDAVGTEESARGRGIGADLLAAGVDWMFSAPTMRKVNLTVNADNIVARNRYEKFGFVTERTMRGYRKQVN